MNAEELMVSFAVIGVLLLLVTCWPKSAYVVDSDSKFDCMTCRDLDDGKIDHVLVPLDRPLTDCPACRVSIENEQRAQEFDSWGTE